MDNYHPKRLFLLMSSAIWLVLSWTVTLVGAHVQGSYHNVTHTISSQQTETSCFVQLFMLLISAK